MGDETMKLKATRYDYEFDDGSGYRFYVTASFDPEFGWSADVRMASHGMKTAKAAVAFLENPVRHFLRQITFGPAAREGEKDDAG